MQNRGRSLSTLPAALLFRIAGVPPALLTLLLLRILQFVPVASGRRLPVGVLRWEPRIHAGEERLSAAKSRAQSRALALDLSATARNTAK
jgi:hypothetical protein